MDYKLQLHNEHLQDLVRECHLLCSLKFARSFFIVTGKKFTCILQICCCQEVPSVKQKVITGNPFVGRPLRLLCKEADGTESCFL